MAITLDDRIREDLGYLSLIPQHYSLTLFISA